MSWLKSTSRFNASSPYPCLTSRGFFLALQWRMAPFVDSDEILPVGGRLKISNLLAMTETLSYHITEETSHLKTSHRPHP